jgi:4'-phosphopantetheinyl transferase
VTAPFDGAEVWLVDLGMAADALEAVEAAEPRLSEEDEGRLARISDAGSRRERHAAHIALRVLVERAFGPRWRRVPYAVSQTGKPGLAGSSGDFSLSHTPGLALIAVAQQGVLGVDVERLRVLRASGERSQRIERAGIALAGGNPLPEAPDMRFLQAWVRIEAAAKAEGCGVGPLLTRLGVGGAPLASEASMPPMPLAIYDLALGSGLVSALALPQGTPLPEVRPFPLDRAGIESLT